MRIGITGMVAAVAVLAGCNALRDAAGLPPRCDALAAESPSRPIAVGDTVRLLTQYVNSGGRAVECANQNEGIWTSDAPAIASVTTDGLVTGRGIGTARLIARSGALSAAVQVTVVGGIPR